MPIKTYADAMVEAIALVMDSDPALNLLGTAYLLGPTGSHPELERLAAQYPDRVIEEPPISESAIAGMAIGSAMAGTRSLAHFGLAAFAIEAWSQLVVEAACAHHQSGGQIKVPAVFTMIHGMTPVDHSQHNRSPYAQLANSPGLQIILPSTPADVKGLLISALRNDNPVVLMNHPLLMASKGEVPEGDQGLPFGVADVKRVGSQVTIVATSHKVLVALEAADKLADEGISVEVVDPRTIVPLDRETITGSIKKTGRLVIVDDSPMTCGFAAEIAALAVESSFDSLKAPVVRVSPPDIPIPRGSIAQTPFRITAERVIQAVKSII